MLHLSKPQIIKIIQKSKHWSDKQPFLLEGVIFLIVPILPMDSTWFIAFCAALVGSSLRSWQLFQTFHVAPPPAYFSRTTSPPCINFQKSESNATLRFTLWPARVLVVAGFPALFCLPRCFCLNDWWLFINMIFIFSTWWWPRLVYYFQWS